MAIDDALMKHPADLADPVVDIHFGTTQAQRRFTAHRHAVVALSTVQTAVFDIAHLLRVTAPEHLVHEAIIVGLIVARIDAFEPVPVLDKDLFEDVPVLRGCCNHQGAPSWGIGMFAVKLFYHTSPALSTPHRRSLGHPHPPHLPLSYGDFRGLENAISYTMNIFSSDIWA